MSKYHISLFCLLLLCACSKNSDDFNVDVNTPEPAVLVIASFEGKVVDTDGRPMPSAQVQLGGLVRLTDQQGRFRIDRVPVTRGGDVVKVSQNGHFDAFARVLPQSERRSFIQLTLVEKGRPQQLSANAGGTLNLNGDASVVLPPNAVRLANGSTYTGTINAYGRWISPSDEQLTEIMPGALSARDHNDNPVVLSTFGMIQFELESVQGAPLELQEGVEVDLSVPIPDELADEAPDEIPSWYFDQELGLWVEEDVCKKSDKTYKLKADKMGTWNCDVPIECAQICSYVQLKDSTMGQYLRVLIDDLNSNFLLRTFTDSVGCFLAHVPINTEMSLRIEDNCRNPLLETTIGPFMDSTKLDTLLADTLLLSETIRFTGLLNQCDNQGAKLGQIGIRYPGRSYTQAVNDDGSFDFDLLVECLAIPEMEITGYDLENGTATAPLVLIPDADNPLGTLTACDSPTSFIQASFNGMSFQVAPAEYVVLPNLSPRLLIRGINVGGGILIELNQYQGIGDYSSQISLESINIPSAEPLVPELDNKQGDFTISVTADNDEFIDGTFEGTIVEKSTQLEFFLSGSFRCQKRL
ncbi:MAG: hypothetical protein AAFV95_15190 [Bacteroidota bacterium]